MRTRLTYLDVLSGIAILGVLLIHAHSYYMVDGAKFYSDTLPWAKWPLVDNILDFVITYSVCLFLFIAGYKYEVNAKIHDIKSYMVYAKKRLGRIIIPFWIILFFLFCYQHIFDQIGTKSAGELFKLFWNIMLGKTPIIYTYWFIPMFIVVSMLYPLLRKAISNHYIRILVLVSVKLVYGYTSFGQYFVWPLHYLAFMVYYEIGALCCRNIDKILSKKIIIPVITVFMGLFVWRNINMDQTMDLKILEILKVFGPLTSFYVAYYLDRFKFSSILVWLGYYSWVIYLYHEPFFMSTAFKYMKILKIEGYFVTTFILAAIGIITSVLFYKLICVLTGKNENSEKIKQSTS